MPKESECPNLIVPVCLSSSHIAYGSIRMEPVFLILGQSAATAASIAIDRSVAVQKVPYDVLRSRLLKDGQVLELARKPRRGAVPAASLEGVVVDDLAAEFRGAWRASSTVGPYVGEGYRHDSDADKGAKSATFRAKLEPGRYRVGLAYTPQGNRADEVPVVVRHSGGETRVKVNQQDPPRGGGPFHPLGTFAFDGDASVEVRNEGTRGYVVVDAVQFLRVPEPKD
ncbi:MAG: FAD-dependent oxidoreductase [Isosphaeraceae bacterium]